MHPQTLVLLAMPTAATVLQVLQMHAHLATTNKSFLQLPHVSVLLDSTKTHRMHQTAFNAILNVPPALVHRVLNASRALYRTQSQ